jgi:hypothetical protein
VEHAKGLVLLPVLALLVAAAAPASELFIYPQKGQSDEQMEKDKFECYSWAKKSSGFDPMAPPTATSAAPKKEAEQGGVVRGAARGALVGVAVGAIAGDAGKGAAIGAAGGGMVGGMRRNDQRRREEQAQNDWEQDQVAQYTRARNDYNRAYAACLEGRNYTVK